MEKKVQAAQFARQNLGLASTMEPLPATPAGLSSGENLAGNVDFYSFAQEDFYLFLRIVFFYSFAQEDP